MDRSEWIAACAHQLQKRWRTVDPETLEDLAADLWADSAARLLPPMQAAKDWLAPVEPPAPRPPAPSPWPSNGILAKLPGDLISLGSRQLPEPTQEQSAQAQTVVVESAHLGAIRVRYQLQEARHRGKSSHFFWCADYAEAVN